MIGWIIGRVLAKAPGRVIVKSMDIGYEVMVDETALSVDQNVMLWIWHHQTEKAVTLFGFSSFEARELAILVAGTDGIGPGTAHKVVTALGYEALVRAVMTGDTSGLRPVKGVGTKKLTDILTFLKKSGKVAAAVDPRIGLALAAIRQLGLDIEAAEAVLIPLAAQQPDADVSQLSQQVIVHLARHKAS